MDIHIDIDSDLSAEATDALTLMALLGISCYIMKRMGLTKWQAMRRMPLAIYRAWEMPHDPR